MYVPPGGGGMWPPLSGAASGGPPVTANGVPFNSLYSSLAQQQTAAAALSAHHPFGVQPPHPYQQPPQPQSMMQRQLGTSQLPNSSSHRGSMMAPPTNGNMRNRQDQLQLARKQEAEKRRKEQQQAEKAAKAQEEFYTNSSLFAAPTRDHSGDNTVAQVLGEFKGAQHMLTDKNNLIGVDYAPPTPAPAQHIIGEEDDAQTASNMASKNPSYPANIYSSMNNHPRPNPNSIQNPIMQRPTGGRYPPGRRMPTNFNETILPTSRSQPHRGTQRPGPMGPPTGPAGPFPTNHTSRDPAAAAAASAAAAAAAAHAAATASHVNAAANNPSRLQKIGNALPILNLPDHKTNEPDMQKIFSDMIVESSIMPPPLSAIITPRITKHEGNRIVKTAYVNPFTPAVSPPPSPIKPIKSPEHNVPSAITANGQAKKDLMHAINLPGVSFGNPRLSEDSESDHQELMMDNKNMAFNPAVIMIEKKPPQNNQNMNNSNSMASSSNNKPSHTTSESESESESESSDDSSDETKKSVITKPPTVTVESVPLDDDDGELTGFGIGGLLSKVRKQSPASLVPKSPMIPECIVGQISGINQPEPMIPTPGDRTDIFRDLDTEDLLGKPLSPLKSSPPASPLVQINGQSDQHNNSSDKRKSRQRPKRPRHTNSSSSDEELKKPEVNKTPTKKRPIKKPTPQRTPQISYKPPNSQDSDDHIDLEDIDPIKSKNKKPSRGRKPKAIVPAPVLPVPVVTSESEDEELIEKLVKSPPIKNKHRSSNSSSRSSSRKQPSRSVSTKSSENNLEKNLKTRENTEQKQLKQHHQPPPVPVVVEPPPKETSNTSAKKGNAINRVFGGFAQVAKTPPSKAARKDIKNHDSNEDDDADDHDQGQKKATAILKRSDGRPILVCRIPLSLIENKSKKRERKTSTSSTASTASKKLKTEQQEVIKPEATNLENLPGYGTTSSSSSSSRSSRTPKSSQILMPPPDQKAEATVEAENIQPQPPGYVETEFEVYMTQAKKLKREADKENNPIMKSTRYIEAVLYFILYAASIEQRGDHAAAYTIYKDTINLVKYILNYRPRLNDSQGGPSQGGAMDSKLTILSYRCQSLLYLKLYKLRKNELKEISQKLEELLKNASDMQSSPVGNGGGSPTPSPAGSEGSVCSKSSGYTSAGELPAMSSRHGVLTPPTHNPGISAGGTMSVPHTLMQKQYNYSNYLTLCHDLWDNAEMFMVRGHCSEFIAHLDQTHGMLTLHSSLKDLVKYTQAGLDYLAKERDSLSRARRH